MRRTPSRPSEDAAIVSAQRKNALARWLSRPRGIESALGQAAVATAAIGVLLLCLYAEVATPIAVTFGAVTLLVLVAATWLLSWFPAAVVVLVSVAVSLLSTVLGGTDPVTARIEIAANVAVFVLVTVGVRATIAAAAREESRAAELRAAADRLDQTNEVLRRFTADAAHELRAPLTVLRSALEAAVAAPDAARSRAQLKSAIGETTRIGQLVEALLLLARNDSGDLVVATTRFDLADLLEEVAGRWAAVAAAHASTLVRDVPDAATAIGDSRLLGQLLDNLLDNALGYSPAGATVSLSARPTTSGWRVTVSDDGPGIPASRRAEVFGRFARLGDRVRTDGRRGSGLGLAICQGIAAQHGTIVRLERSPSGGTAAGFDLLAQNS